MAQQDPRPDITPIDGPPLQTCETAVEIYLLIAEMPGFGYTRKSIQEIIAARYGQPIPRQRVQQILDVLHARGRITKRIIDGDYNNIPVAVYQYKEGNTILMDSPAYNIMSILYDYQNGRSKESA